MNLKYSRQISRVLVLHGRNMSHQLNKYKHGIFHIFFVPTIKLTIKLSKNMVCNTDLIYYMSEKLIQM